MASEPTMTKGLREELQRLGVSPSKSRGQNFLPWGSASELVLEFAEVSPEEHVLEIGPGLGVLSSTLQSASKSYRAVEIDEKLCAHLCTILREEEVICADVRTINVREIFPEGRVVVVSNVPYSISTEFCEWLFDNRRALTRASLLLQREFAERLAAEPGNRTYGMLSVFRKRFARAALGPIVPGTSFYPEAAVDSRLVSLYFFPEVEVPASFRKVVQAAFSHRRKTLLNSLSGSHLGLDRQTAADLLSDAEIDARRRAEELDLDDFLRLTECYNRRMKLI